MEGITSNGKHFASAASHCASAPHILVSLKRGVPVPCYTTVRAQIRDVAVASEAARKLGFLWIIKV